MTREVRLLARNALDGFMTERPISDHTRDMYRAVLLACAVYSGERFAQVLVEITHRYVVDNSIVAKEADLDFITCLSRVMSMNVVKAAAGGFFRMETLQLREYPYGTTNVERWIGSENPQAAHMNFDCSIDTAVLLLLAERVK